VPDDAGPVLLSVARAAICSALGRVTAAQESAPWLRQPGATFVTLMRHDQLRGCIGSLEARRPLGDDVKSNAVAAALQDTRFSPLTVAELDDLVVEVSLLSAPEPLPVTGEDDLLRQLRPGLDGIVLQRGLQRATFLPQVWEQLPEPRVFVEQLKRKAGLPPGVWDERIRVERYTVRKWSEKDAGR
jgi:AmmeMemoRadiSam system protein A